MKFRYYITDLGKGVIEGSNDPALIADLCLCEDYFIVDTETGLWINTSGSDEIVEVKHDGF